MPSIRPSRPTLSVVLCTYNRAELLRRTLDSLCRQSLDKALFEVVVIDDGSKDDTRQVVLAYESLLPLRYSHQRNAGLGSARNHGVFLSRGDILLFLDDDDIADTRVLEEHLSAHRYFPDDRYGVLGYTGLDPAIADDPLMHYVTRVGCFLFSYPSIKDGDVRDFGCPESFVYVVSPSTALLAARESHVMLAANAFGKGRSVFFAGLPYSLENSRLLYRTILWSCSREGELRKWFTSNLNMDCAAYPEAGVFVVVNNADSEQTTTLYDGSGAEIEVTLPALASRWYKIEG